MIIYWVFFAIPAVMALAYPVDARRYSQSRGQAAAMTGFILIYVLIGGLRHQTGGDWLSYYDIFEDIRHYTFTEAIGRTDPLYGILNWISAGIGGGIYLSNAVCCGLIGYGAVSAAKRFHEPWLALVIAVPYLLIVVGLGYVRQGAAIGLVLIAIASLDRASLLRSFAFLVAAIGFHSTAVFALPIFVFAVATRNKMLALVGAVVAGYLYQNILAPRLDFFSAGYLGSEYDSQGALVRILMGAIPSVLLLARRKWFVARPQARIVWQLIGVANLVALAALFISPSSTAVDRVGLYFSIIQLAAFGEFAALVGVSARNTVLVRFGLIGVAASVQLVWLVFAVHSEFWVPYRSILQLI